MWELFDMNTKCTLCLNEILVLTNIIQFCLLVGVCGKLPIESTLLILKCIALNNVAPKRYCFMLDHLFVYM